MLAEKIHLVTSHKNNIYDIYVVGERVQQVLDQCSDENCDCLSFFKILKIFWIELREKKQHPNKIFLFHRFCFNNKIFFLLHDQINKKYGSEIFNMEISI